MANYDIIEPQSIRLIIPPSAVLSNEYIEAAQVLQKQLWCGHTGRGVHRVPIRGDTTTQCVDYGLFYASKTFLTADGRRVIIGSVTNRDGPLRAWQGLQSAPRGP